MPPSCHLGYRQTATPYLRLCRCQRSGRPTVHGLDDVGFIPRLSPLMQGGAGLHNLLKLLQKLPIHVRHKLGCPFSPAAKCSCALSNADLAFIRLPPNCPL